ncbi:hypothetical protein [Athalassotoga saccharophila]|uniref:hypothetical protein n=1 Tax=Athalassotoga saccharophila TaxID=1441386 RepID=UPI00137AE502|nr:hypothetical protein [Athalassotoga saccharophila]BBJ28966.1 hypothetical protein ATHSA_1891 [Athalassotoga saccharophila]
MGYNASFSGVTGNVLTNAYNTDRVLLAKLAVQSNMSTITVTVSTGVNGGSLTSGINPPGLPNGMILKYSDNYDENVLTLQPKDSDQYSGELDIFASKSIESWVAPGKIVITFQFTIIPNCGY